MRELVSEKTTTTQPNKAICGKGIKYRISEKTIVMAKISWIIRLSFDVSMRSAIEASVGCKKTAMTLHKASAVSYTHLDVYKRQLMYNKK